MSGHIHGQDGIINTSPQIEQENKATKTKNCDTGIKLKMVKFYMYS
jgi:hypothetical protein